MTKYECWKDVSVETIKILIQRTLDSMMKAKKDGANEVIIQQHKNNIKHYQDVIKSKEMEKTIKCRCGTEMITTDEEEKGYTFKMYHCPNCKNLKFSKVKKK